MRYTDAPDKFKIVSVAKQISAESLLSAISRPTDGGYKIKRLLGEFKGEIAGEAIDYFDTVLEIGIEYSPVAWALAKDPIDGVPKVAYLARDNGDWAANWVLFVDNGNDVNISYQAPDGDSPGYVIILKFVRSSIYSSNCDFWQFKSKLYRQTLGNLN